MYLKKRLSLLCSNFLGSDLKPQQEQSIKAYISGGRKPWTPGYSLVKRNLIEQSLSDSELLNLFYRSSPLPDRYGEFLDERVVEYPWLISKIGPNVGRFLDAGSALNFEYILVHDKLQSKEITIVTLEPETECFWKRRVSYLFSDIRALPLKDNWFDEVASISTIEHIGMNNSIYSANTQWQENKSLDFLKAVAELKRVTKPGGKVYITVPYGKYTNFGWYQQFNADMIHALIEEFCPSKKIETYFKYENGGWNFSDAESCKDCEGFNIHDTKYFNPDSDKDYDPDYAACSRGIAALELWK